MNNRKFFKVCSFFIALGCICLALGICLGGRVYGITFGKGGFKVETEKNINATSHEKVEMVSASDELEAFDTIDLDVAFAEVRIVESDHYGIEYSFPEDIIPEYKVAKNKLTVKTKGDIANDFRITFLSDKRNVKDGFSSILILSVPKGIEFKDVKLELSGGVIGLNDIKSTDIYVKNGLGNVEFNNIEAEDVRIDVASGNIFGNSIKSVDADLSSSFGNGVIDEIEAEDLKMKFTSGSIKVTKISGSEAFASCSYGVIEIKEVNSDEFSVNNSGGSITVDEISSESIDARTSFGEIKLGLDDIEKYNIDCKANFGDIKVSGVSKGGSYSVSAPENKKSIEANCSSGEITLN